MSGTAPVTSFWRMAGMTYLQYANRAANSLRSACKEPARSKLMAQGEFSYKSASYSAGKQGPKTPISTLGAVGKE